MTRPIPPHLKGPMRRRTPPDLTGLHELHGDAMIGPQQVRAMLGGISDTSLWRLVREGKLAPPLLVLPKVRRWHVRDVRDTIATLERSWPSKAAA